MPEVRTSADLRERYDEISALCHERPEPIFITQDGRDDLAVMSIETYENITAPNGKAELYNLIQEGLNDIRDGNIRPIDDVMRDIRRRRQR